TRGALRPLPRRQFMGVPADLDELAATGVISPEGVARARDEAGSQAQPRSRPGPGPLVGPGSGGETGPQRGTVSQPGPGPNGPVLSVPAGWPGGTGPALGGEAVPEAGAWPDADQVTRAEADDVSVTEYIGARLGAEVV